MTILIFSCTLSFIKSTFPPHLLFISEAPRTVPDKQNVPDNKQKASSGINIQFQNVSVPVKS